MKLKGLGLLSGGLDSSLSALILLKKGIYVEGVYFNNGFCIIENQRILKGEKKKIKNPIEDFSSNYNIPIKFEDIRDDFLEILKKPKYGFGSSMNPCIDCRILMFKKAKEIMDREKFDFIFTGEVLRQRPMTQFKRTLYLIEKEAGVKGLVIRPLSQKLLKETILEKEGKISREDFYDIEGRSRKRQLEIAKEFGLKDYPTPAGGCCYLTDINYKGRFLDLFKFKEKDKIKPLDFLLLKYGRHFRLSKDIKLIIGRNEEENNLLLEYGKDFIIILPNSPAPAGLLDFTKDENLISLACNIILSYSKRKGKIKFEIFLPQGEKREVQREYETLDIDKFKIK